MIDTRPTVVRSSAVKRHMNSMANNAPEITPAITLLRGKLNDTPRAFIHSTSTAPPTDRNPARNTGPKPPLVTLTTTWLNARLSANSTSATAPNVSIYVLRSMPPPSGAAALKSIVPLRRARQVLVWVIPARWSWLQS